MALRASKRTNEEVPIEKKIDPQDSVSKGGFRGERHSEWRTHMNP